MIASLINQTISMSVLEFAFICIGLLILGGLMMRKLIKDSYKDEEHLSYDSCEDKVK